MPKLAVDSQWMAKLVVNQTETLQTRGSANNDQRTMLSANNAVSGRRCQWTTKHSRSTEIEKPENNFFKIFPVLQF